MSSTTRRRLLKTLGVGAAVGVAGCSSSCPDGDAPDPSVVVDTDGADGAFETLPGGSWPSPRFDAGNTGYAPVSPPTNSLALRWRTTLRTPRVDGAVDASSPAVTDGGVYVATGAGAFALSLRDGTERWRYDTTPATTSLTVGYDDELVPPVVADGRVYLSTADGIVALHADDGTVAWRATDAAATGVPTVDDGVVVPTADGLVALHADDGTRRWRADVNATMPAVADGTVVTGGEKVVALDAVTGDPEWSAAERAEFYPVVAGGTVYLGTYSRLVGVALDDGRERWAVERGGGRTFSAPVVAPETVYTVERPGEAPDATFALGRVDNGPPEPRWCSYVGEGSVAAAAGDHAFALQSGSASSSLVAFTERFGEAAWGYAAANRPVPPAVLDGGVVSVTDRGTVAALGGV
ncbi:MAG: PQQ-binding-like beta-propeller repeat protein [Haloplanus sp.]